jgi:hypothetical protein
MFLGFGMWVPKFLNWKLGFKVMVLKMDLGFKHNYVFGMGESRKKRAK